MLTIRSMESYNIKLRDYELNKTYTETTPNQGSDRARVTIL